MNRFTLLVLVPVLLVTMGNYCEQVDVLDDVGFQFWCGDELCAWEVEEGAVQKAPTWHAHDYAVELVGSPVLLSQRAAESFGCLRIELIADVEPSAMVTVEIDYGGDGVIDSVTAVVGEGFRSMAWDDCPGSAGDEGSIFYVRKAGKGRAVITQLRAFD